MKPRWKKPEIIALVRGKPEEAVLGNCKTRGMVGPQNTPQKECQNAVPGEAACRGNCKT